MKNRKHCNCKMIIGTGFPEMTIKEKKEERKKGKEIGEGRERGKNKWEGRKGGRKG